MKCYKLTDQDGKTKNNCQWGEGVTHTTDGSGDLCSSGWLHFYENALIGLILNPTHRNFKEPRLWLAECGETVKRDRWLKAGSTSLTTVKELPLPPTTPEKRAEFAIRCAMEVYKDPAWTAWATDWLTGKDRSTASAAVASHAACQATNAASAAYAACNAAFAACQATNAASAAYAACNAAYAASRAAAATYYAARYATDAASNATDFPWQKILRETFREPEFAEYL